MIYKAVIFNMLYINKYIYILYDRLNNGGFLELKPAATGDDKGMYMRVLYTS